MSASAAVDPDAARRTARSILSGHEYRPERSPAPLRGALRWIGDRVHDIVDPVVRFLDRVFGGLFHLIPGTAGIVLGVAILLGVVGLVTWLLARRVAASGPVRTAAGGGHAAGDVEDPDALERAARDAAAAGDHRLAVRLRYRAGLLRLGSRGAIALRPGATNAVYARALRSPRFDGLTDTFESVTYGTTPAGPDDDATASAEWPRVVDEAGRR